MLILRFGLCTYQTRFARIASVPLFARYDRNICPVSMIRIGERIDRYVSFDFKSYLAFLGLC